MIQAALDHTKMRTSLDKVYFVLFDEAALKVFEETYAELAGRKAERG